MKYSKDPKYQLIRSFVEAENGEFVDVCEEYFTIQLPTFQKPLKLTFQPAVYREKEIELIATGSPALESILIKCLQNGTVCSLLLKLKDDPREFIRKYFKDSEYHCNFCEKVTIGEKELYFCVKNPKCYHKINNAKIQSIKILNSEKIRLVQFYFSVFFRNKLKKNEEIIKILLDQEGHLFDHDILENVDVEFIDSEEKIDLMSLDSLKIIADEKLDESLKNKKNVFEVMLKKEISRRINKIGEKLEVEKLQHSISKKAHLFNEEKWKQKKDKAIEREEQSLRTRISIKFVNLLIVTTSKVNFEIYLSNNSKISSSFIVGVSDKFEIVCPSCKKTIETGYATIDGFYLCKDCIKQSIETGKIYSNNVQLTLESTTKEFIEMTTGFNCSVCETLNSKLFEYKCNQDNSSVCYRCYEICSKCKKMFSVYNTETCKESGNKYCNQHIIHCQNCGNPVGIDQYRLCKASGKKFCSCTQFQKCVLCENEYSLESLENKKCPGCSSLSTLHDESFLLPIIELNSDYNRTKNWVIGKNANNLILIAKGRFSDTVFVIDNKKVMSTSKISFIRKMKGY